MGEYSQIASIEISGVYWHKNRIHNSCWTLPCLLRSYSGKIVYNSCTWLWKNEFEIQIDIDIETMDVQAWGHKEKKERDSIVVIWDRVRRWGKVERFSFFGWWQIDWRLIYSYTFDLCSKFILSLLIMITISRFARKVQFKGIRFCFSTNADPYYILGVDKTAPFQEIKLAFYKLAN